jgi:tryptophan halogenase|tara:strand:+ start:2415 stop:3920 length:1506 start_codon:yes stop_codon:yes gene_type:complete
MIQSLTVLGGGTSGLVAALTLRKSHPLLNLKLLRSSKIGIIGVGEGSTEHWARFMHHIDVDVPTIVRECGATFKIGIKFTNWQGDGKHYFHSLTEQFAALDPLNEAPVQWMRMIAEDWDPNDTVWKRTASSLHAEPFHDSFAQYHFDTNKLNEFFTRLCVERGIEVLDVDIEDVILDETGNVKELIDEAGTKHASDFFIDCSGFNRVISSKLGQKWIDCGHQLPMNSAIAFPTARTEDIPSYTEATALSSGWCWRIPTQDRYGNGYVFSDNFINETQAYDEVSQHYEKHLGIKDLEIGKRVKFNAGYVNECWTKNCVSLGLSAMFVEPLEATSIGSTIQQVNILVGSLLHYRKNNDAIAKRFNERMNLIATNIIDFIQIHYLTKRNDSEFWRWCDKGVELTPFNKETLDSFKTAFPNSGHFVDPSLMFSYLNWTQVMHGLHLFDYDACKKFWETNFAERHNESLTNLMKKELADWPDEKIYTHREALNILKERYLEVSHEL